MSPNNTAENKKRLLAAILGVGTLLYLIAIVWIGIGSIDHVNRIEAAVDAAAGATQGVEAGADEADPLPAPAPYPISDYIAQAILVIGGALATHLGAYLGISITKAGAVAMLTKDVFGKLNDPEVISGLLAVTYFLTLVAAIAFWAFTGFSAYAGKPLQELAYTFLGVFAGAMAALSQG